MSAKTKVCRLLLCLAAAGVCASPIFAGPLPTHGAVKHLDSGPVAVGISPMTFTAFGADGLVAPPNGYHWEIEIWNTGGFPEVFDMAVKVQTPAGPVTLGAGTATVPAFKTLYWEYYLNPDPFGEIAPLAVKTTYTKPRIGLVPLAFQTTITEDPMPAQPPCPGRVPPPPDWVALGAGPDVGGSPGSLDVVFELMLPESTTQPGDSNGDGKVDAADYVAWLKMDGSPGGYANWRSNFGESGGLGGTMEAPSNAVAVPEPASALLLILAAALGNSWRRRRD